jgi:hypothetical protein
MNTHILLEACESNATGQAIKADAAQQSSQTLFKQPGYDPAHTQDNYKAQEVWDKGNYEGNDVLKFSTYRIAPACHDLLLSGRE